LLGLIVVVLLTVVLGRLTVSRCSWDGITKNEPFWIVTVSIENCVVGTTLFKLLVEVVVYEVILLGVTADVLVSGNAVKMNLVEHGSLRAHERVLSSSDTVMEGLAVNGGIGVITILLLFALER